MEKKIMILEMSAISINIKLFFSDDASSSASNSNKVSCEYCSVQ